jgi:small-conductance mechanosensitive channel
VLADLGSRALGAMPGLFTVMVIFLAARLITRAIGGFFSAVDAGTVSLRGLDIDTARATRRIVTTLVWLFALTVAYPYIPGSETEAFKAIGVFAGLMVTLGSAGFIGQVMSGLMVVYSRALKPGELVRVNDVVGMVSEVGMLSTRIVSPTREEITIPNASLVGSTVTNYSRLASENGVTFVSTAVTIGYDVPWRQVHGLLVRAAERTPGIRAAPPAYVVQRALSDFYVDYELRAPLVRAEERFRVLSDLHAQIQDAFNEFGVQIMSPNFEAQPDKPVLVPKSDWFTPPAAPPDGGSAGEGR